MNQTPPPLPSDGQLLDGARQGMSGAWDELVRRHGPAVSGAARSRRRFGAKKAVEGALEALRVDIGAGDRGPDDQPALPPGTETESAGFDGSDDDAVGVRAVRPRLLAELTGGCYGPGASVDESVAHLTLPGTARLDIDLDDLASVARAFAALPEPWQTALWHRIVEQQTAAEYAPLLGRAANDAAAAVQRADAGLFEHYLLDQRAHSAVAPACVPIIPLLGGSLRSTLSAHEQRLVTVHLGAGDTRRDAEDAPTGCDACARRIAVSRELSTLLPAATVPDLTGLSVERYRAASGVRPMLAVTDPDERRRRFAFGAIFGALLLAVGAAVFFARESLDVIDADPPAESSPTETVDGTPTSAPDRATTIPAPTTTELELRPSPTGTVNGVAFVFDGTAAVGFAPPPSDLSVVLSSPGPVFAGGSGTIDLAITNSGDATVETAATVEVPSGVVFETVIDGPATCIDPVDRSVRCDVSIPAGTTERVTVRFRVSSVVVGRLVVESNLAVESVEVQIAAIHRLVHSSVDEGQMITAGNTLMTCVETVPSCTDARNGVGDIVNRWDFPSEFIGGDLGPGWFNSSSATIDLGAGTVDAAYLFWSGDLSERDVVIPNDGRSGRVLIVPPGADAAIELDAEHIRLGDVDATQYFGSVEVTDLVNLYGSGEYTVGNVQSAEVQGSYAGWSLIVVTRDDAFPRRSNAVISPFSWFSPDDPYAIEIAVPFGPEHRATLDVVAFEGERGFVPEQLTVAGKLLSDAAFDSSIIGQRNPSYDNNFGIDIDAYDLVIDASTGNLPIKVTSDKDGIRLAVLALAVDVE